ncbi:MAG TPA: NTP transferase domain-containing protein, partial [Polyangiaceae bacterium]
MQAVVLAGGLATRLGERARELPKALLPIAGRPFLAWQMQAIARSGFSEVVLCIAHLGLQ